MKRLTFSFALLGYLMAAPCVQAQLEVPLYYDASERRVGIYLGVGGSSQQIFLFDTGSQPLILNSGTDSGTATNQNQTGQIDYGLGDFVFDSYSGDVQMMDAGGNTYGSAVNMNFGKSHEVGGMNTGPGINTGAGYAGIMGAGPAGDIFNNSNGSTNGTTPTFNLFSLMGQQTLAPGLMPGFTVRIRSETDATLTIGVSADAWNATPSKVAMNPADPSLPQQYPDGTPTHLNNQLNTTLTLTSEDGNDTYTSAGEVETRLDTGAQEFLIREDGTTIDIPSSFQQISSAHVDPNNTIGLLADGSDGPSSDWGFSFVSTFTGTTEVDVSSDSDPSLNAGLEPFLQYDITFLLDDGDGNGFIGFTAIPEPATGSLLLAAGFAWLLRRRQQ